MSAGSNSSARASWATRAAIGGDRRVGAVEHPVEARPAGRPARSSGPVGRVVELEPGRVQEQPGRVDAAVLVVADDRHAEGGGVDPHLVGATGVGMGVEALERARRRPGGRSRSRAAGRRARLDRRRGSARRSAGRRAGGRRGRRAARSAWRPSGPRTAGPATGWPRCVLPNTSSPDVALSSRCRIESDTSGTLALHPLVHAVLGVDVGAMGVDPRRLGHDEQVLVLEPDPRLSHRRSLGTRRRGRAPSRWLDRPTSQAWTSEPHGEDDEDRGDRVDGGVGDRCPGPRRPWWRRSIRAKQVAGAAEDGGQLEVGDDIGDPIRQWTDRRTARRRRWPRLVGSPGAASRAASGRGTTSSSTKGAPTTGSSERHPEPGVAVLPRSSERGASCWPIGCG